MPFPDAVKSVLTQYATFDGRARRSEYWWFALFSFLVSIVTNIIDVAIGNQIIGGLVSLALLVPSLAVSCRRLHDTGRSGWWILIAFTIVGIIFLIVWYCTDSESDNQYGPNPKGVDGGMPAYPQSGPYGA